MLLCSSVDRPSQKFRRNVQENCENSGDEGESNTRSTSQNKSFHQPKTLEKSNTVQ